MPVASKQRNKLVSVNLVDSYCLPKLLYGCESWPVAKMNLSELLGIEALACTYFVALLLNATICELNNLSLKYDDSIVLQ